VTILMQYALAPLLDTSSARVARLLAEPPPPAPLREIRADVEVQQGRPRRLWTGEVRGAR